MCEFFFFCFLLPAILAVTGAPIRRHAFRRLTYCNYVIIVVRVRDKLNVTFRRVGVLLSPSQCTRADGISFGKLTLYTKPPSSSSSSFVREIIRNIIKYCKRVKVGRRLPPSFIWLGDFVAESVGNDRQTARPVNYFRARRVDDRTEIVAENISVGISNTEKRKKNTVTVVASR